MSRSERVIFHSDCNAFYASVEEVLHPELKQVPMAVCGNPESRRGIILAKNELAKGFGVQTAETIWQARQKCPKLVLAPARHALYRRFCEQINAIYIQYTDQVQRFSIDESYLDVTGSLHLFGGDALALAHQIRERVVRETGITVSVGISYNKVFAKMASDLKKPNAVTLVSRANYRQVLWPLPVSTLLMVGHSTQRTLNLMGIETIGQLAQMPRPKLTQCLGKLGEQLHRNANGLDEEPVLHVNEVEPVHSIGNGITFKRNLRSQQDIQTAVGALADQVAWRLRQSGLKCRSVQVVIKDADFQVISRQKQLEQPTWLAVDLAQAAMSLIAAAWRVGRPIRMLSVTGQKLVLAEQVVEQLSLFEEIVNEPVDKEKQEKLASTIDQIRARFGPHSITSGSLVQNDLGIHEDYGKDEK